MASSGNKEDRLVGESLRRAAREHPDRRFVQCGGPWFTYREIDELSDSLAAGLQSIGARQGDRIAVILPNRIEYVVAMFALAKIGVIQVPINTFLRGEFLYHQLSQTESSTIIADAPALKHLAPLLPRLPAVQRIVSVDPVVNGEIPGLIPYPQLIEAEERPAPVDIDMSDLCNILYTSGTTGPSKGCMLSHGYYTYIPQAFKNAGWFLDDDVIFGANQMFHASGQIWLVMNALFARGAAVVEPEFHASTMLSRARETGATVIFGFGAMAAALIARPPSVDDRDHTVRQATWVPMTASDQELFEKRFGISVNSGVYGQSECWPATIMPAGCERVPMSLGVVAPDMEVRLVDDDDFEVPVGEPGEIVLRSRQPHMMFQGYWANPDATVKAFRNLWHHTGDNGRFDEAGHLYFVDRKKDSLRRRGENVSSMELEQALRNHDAIVDAAVHAVPSALTEDDIKACIVLAPGASVDPEDLFAFFKAQLPYYAIPRYVEVLDDLPRTPSMRVQKFVLRERGITESTWDLEALGLVVERSERRT